MILGAGSCCFIDVSFAKIIIALGTNTALARGFLVSWSLLEVVFCVRSTPSTYSWWVDFFYYPKKYPASLNFPTPYLKERWLLDEHHDTLDGRNPPVEPHGFIDSRWCRIFEPSTVCLLFHHQLRRGGSLV